MLGPQECPFKWTSVIPSNRCAKPFAGRCPPVFTSRTPSLCSASLPARGSRTSSTPGSPNSQSLDVHYPPVTRLRPVYPRVTRVPSKLRQRAFPQYPQPSRSLYSPPFDICYPPTICRSPVRTRTTRPPSSLGQRGCTHLRHSRKARTCSPRHPPPSRAYACCTRILDPDSLCLDV